MLAFAYVYVGSEWRILEGFVLFKAIGYETIYSRDGKPERYVKSLLALNLGDENNMKVDNIRHYDSRISAEYYVEFNEFTRLMLANVMGDWKDRHCWKASYDDAVRIAKTYFPDELAAHPEIIEPPL